MSNFILKTDSYKLGHWQQYPEGTEAVFSYLEAREGAQYERTVFFGLQSILHTLSGAVVTQADVDWAASVAKAHFGNPNLFNRKGWEFIVNECRGRLPLHIRAVAEGTPVPNSNVLMTVENTRPEAFWLTNAVESLLLHVWYPTTVASVSYNVKQVLKRALGQSSDNPDAVNFMLHDFGYRGAATDDAAAIGGAAHLVNFLGTDTLPAMELLMSDYSADPTTLAFSVPATEHSVMTALGREGEMDQVQRLLEQYPTGIVSCVADSYNIYQFADAVGERFKDQILARDGKFVVRPDSTTLLHTTPAMLVIELLNRLWYTIGGTTNSKGYRVLDPHVGLLWGDGIDPRGIAKIVDTMVMKGWSAENIVFGMGGGLLQKVNRDTQRFAFKSSAQKRHGLWYDVYKEPLDATKKSKKGRLKLIQRAPHGWATVRATADGQDLLRSVFYDGETLIYDNLDDIRARAA
jgi:nicotinamide phosphoribosyltransferase